MLSGSPFIGFLILPAPLGTGILSAPSTGNVTTAVTGLAGCPGGIGHSSPLVKENVTFQYTPADGTLSTAAFAVFVMTSLSNWYAFNTSLSRTM